MNDTPICPCESFEHPQVISNPPGRDTVAYRVGDYTTFRHALLLPLKDAQGQPQEMELQNWNPSAKGDLALQIVEWWAYLADILTFYNERIANESYLLTAELPESVQRLIRLLGYRPRPGIGATGTVTALMNSRTSFKLPQGFQLQSKPGPGKQPQVFELDAATSVAFPDAVEVNPKPVEVGSKPVAVGPTLSSEKAGLLSVADKSSSVLLKGAMSTVKVRDKLLILKKAWNVNAPTKDIDYALVTVADVQREKDSHSHPNTRVIFDSHTPLASAKAEDYRLLKSVQFAHLWPYPADSKFVIDDKKTTIHLEAITRGIKVGDPVIFEIPGKSEQLVSVTKYNEIVYYAKPKDSSTNPSPDPTIPPDPKTEPPVPIPHTQITIQPALLDIPASSDVDNRKAVLATVLVHYAWQDVGQLIETPATAFSAVPATVTAVPPAVFPPINKPLPVLLEDANGQGVPVTASVNTDGSLQLTNLPNPPVALTPPLRVLFNLLSVSRGKTVANEILGSGDASVAGQEFVLQKTPLTYLPSKDPTLTASYQSTLRVWVNDVEWQEVASFYDQTRDAHIFVTREDENNQTHVLFGDGVNGARLPSGVNVVASYRYGSGADAPDAGTLTVIQQPHPGLKALRNPVAAGGGSDPDPPAQIRRYAPQSVLTFGRAVSMDDYETIAAQTPGVARARAYWTFDPDAQRTLITLYVGDDANAVHAARTALARTADPNRPVQIKQAQSVPIKLKLILRIDPRFIPDTVIVAARVVLLDPGSGLFGTQVICIGQSIFRSQLFKACLNVPGVLAVHKLQVWINSTEKLEPRYDPGQGYFFQLQAEDLTISSEVASDV